MDGCIFCKIVRGEFDSARIWEDGEFVALLDVNPNTKGMTLVLTKEHYPSYAFRMPQEAYARFLNASREVGVMLERGLGVKRVAMVMEGMGIDHAHIKLYPLYGLEKEFQQMWAKDRVSFDRYNGYISTQLGPKADLGELKSVAERIKAASG